MKMSLEDFVDKYMVEELDDMIQESVWTSDSFNTNDALEMAENMAKEKGIELIEESLDSYDSLFMDIYNATEKGLS